MSRLTDEQTEALLRRGLDQIAGRAPDAGHVRERLAQRAKPRPVARLVAVAAAVVVVAAGVPLGMKVFARPQVQVVAAWVPVGFAEQAADDNTRRWRSGSAEIALTIYGTDEREWSDNAMRIAQLRSQILVKGRVAEFTEQAATSVLTWSPDRDHVLQLRLTGVPDARDTALRIAENVKDS